MSARAAALPASIFLSMRWNSASRHSPTPSTGTTTSSAFRIAAGYALGMTQMATIKVPRRVRDKVRDAAKAAHVTQGQLIEELLQERRKAEFWGALESETPDKAYLDELDEADQAFAADAETAITDYEAGL